MRTEEEEEEGEEEREGENEVAAKRWPNLKAKESKWQQICQKKI